LSEDGWSYGVAGLPDLVASASLQVTPARGKRGGKEGEGRRRRKSYTFVRR
jgi:hypothetical protein